MPTYSYTTMGFPAVHFSLNTAAVIATCLVPSSKSVPLLTPQRRGLAWAPSVQCSASTDAMMYPHSEDEGRYQGSRKDGQMSKPIVPATQTQLIGTSLHSHSTPPIARITVRTTPPALLRYATRWRLLGYGSIVQPGFKKTRGMQRR
jgi:hypothetical protein